MQKKGKKKNTIATVFGVLLFSAVVLIGSYYMMQLPDLYKEIIGGVIVVASMVVIGVAAAKAKADASTKEW